MTDQAPDPLETVTVLKSDFDLLQAAANAAMEDYKLWLELLSITPAPDKAPREVMYEQVFPAVVAILASLQQVNQASEVIGQMVTDAKRRGGKEIDLGDGRKAVLAGKKNPQLLTGLQPLSRSERRRFDREIRHGR